MIDRTGFGIHHVRNDNTAFAYAHDLYLYVGYFFAQEVALIEAEQNGMFFGSNVSVRLSKMHRTCALAVKYPVLTE